MSKKSYIIGTLVFCGALLIYLLLHKNELERFVDRGIKGFQQENQAAIIGLLSQEYVDREHLTRTAIESGLGKLFADFDDLKIIVSGIETKFLDRNTGSIRFNVKVVASLAKGAKLGGTIDLSIYGNSRFFLVGGPTTEGQVSLLVNREGSEWKLKEIQEFNVGYTVAEADRGAAVRE